MAEQSDGQLPFQQLDFLYVPSRDVARDLAFFRRGARRQGRVRDRFDGDAGRRRAVDRGSAARSADGSPRGRPADPRLPRAGSRDGARTARGKRLATRAHLRDPARSHLFLRGLWRAPRGRVSAHAAGGRGALRGSSRLLRVLHRGIRLYASRRSRTITGIFRMSLVFSSYSAKPRIRATWRA
jgi:hypothetical protein